MKNKKIYISGDHAGFNLKEEIKPWLQKEGYEIREFGPYDYKKDDDYPDFIISMAKALVKDKDKNSRGLIIAGSGQGEMIAANKLKGIRAALFYGGNLKIIKTTRKHNDSNILCIGARFIRDEAEVKKAIDLFLKTRFSNAGRHKRRLEKFKSLGSKL
ncbi:MAG: RpiB/LacA/LacB family sugar-phosphate isomerase [Candidatus Pacearchaeota archaeon]